MYGVVKTYNNNTMANKAKRTHTLEVVSLTNWTRVWQILLFLAIHRYRGDKCRVWFNICNYQTTLNFGLFDVDLGIDKDKLSFFPFGSFSCGRLSASNASRSSIHTARLIGVSLRCHGHNPR